MADTIEAIRAKARAHQHELDAAARFYTVQDLATRWAVSAATVRSIPRARLPYTAIGRGVKRQHRRYAPADVARYEQGEATAA